DRITKISPTAYDSSRLGLAFRLCVAREPNAIEQQRLSTLLTEQRNEFAANPQEAELLLPAKTEVGVPTPEFAAWTAVCRVLMNLDEFITRE
ncbi:MAG: hypothetical protein NT069_16360, partial [Planctomycetota bacterium]|nr:hypothetical protein [Planctomycetota bacterium]